MSDTPFDAIVLGAGAAGMMCAMTAGARGKRVLLIDHADAPGKKILISGGGRCNFTNVNTAADRYLSSNPHFAKSALGRYTPQDFLALVESHGIAWHEKTLGQLFCDGSARQIVDMLADECVRAGVTLLLGQPVTDVAHADGRFRIRVDGRDFAAPALVLATGGPSIPKLGATGFAYDAARRFGLSIVQPRPAGCWRPSANARAWRCAARWARLCPSAWPMRCANGWRWTGNWATCPTRRCAPPKRALPGGASRPTAPKASPRRK